MYKDVGGATETNKQCWSSQRLSICFPYLEICFPCLDLGRGAQIPGRGPPTGRWCPGKMEFLCYSCTEVRRKEVEEKQPGFFLSTLLSPVRTLHCSSQWKPEGKRAWGEWPLWVRPWRTKTNQRKMEQWVRVRLRKMIDVERIMWPRLSQSDTYFLDSESESLGTKKLGWCRICSQWKGQHGLEGELPVLLGKRGMSHQ